MKPFIVIVPGHGHRVRDLRWDPGACSGVLQEAVQVRILARALAAALHTAGVPHVVGDPTGIQDGHEHALRGYGARTRAGLDEAKRLGASCAIVLHLHLNAGAGKYGLVVTDARSPTEVLVASPFVATVQRWGGAALTQCKNETDHNYPRARSLHNAVWGEGRFFPSMSVSSLVLEPAFIDQPQHVGLCGDGGMFSLAHHLAGCIAAL